MGEKRTWWRIILLLFTQKGEWTDLGESEEDIHWISYSSSYTICGFTEIPWWPSSTWGDALIRRIHCHRYFRDAPEYCHYTSKKEKGRKRIMLSSAKNSQVAQLHFSSWQNNYFFRSLITILLCDRRHPWLRHSFDSWLYIKNYRKMYLLELFLLLYLFIFCTTRIVLLYLLVVPRGAWKNRLTVNWYSYKNIWSVSLNKYRRRGKR